MPWLETLNAMTNRVPVGAGAAAEVLQWSYQPHLPDNVPHRHTFFEICLVGSWGEGIFIAESRPNGITSGDLFIARPGVVHQIVNTENSLMELFWVSLRWDGAGAGEMAGLIETFSESQTVVVVPDRGGRIGTLWRALRLLPGDDEAVLIGAEAQLELVMSALLLAILQAGAGFPLARATPAPRTDAHTSRARAALRYIDDNLNRPLPVGEIARHVHLSPRHLTRLLTEFAGVAPAAYVEQARMDRARTLLLRSDTAIKQIAPQVGYADVHHFTRVFTRAFGCPPGRYRLTNGAADRTARGANIQKPGVLV
jgi:AraC family transcriptional regulator of arabinose operon